MRAVLTRGYPNRSILPVRPLHARSLRVRAERGCGLPTKEKAAETATFCPAYGHIGARRCRTDWGAWGVIYPTLINAIAIFRFLTGAKIFQGIDGRARRTPKSKRRRGRRRPGHFIEVVDLLTVLLNARGAQAGEPVAIDGVLPGEKFLDRERIAAARLFERQKAASHRCHDFGLAADHPTLGPRRRQIRDGERATVGPDHIFHPRAVGFGHGYSQALDRQN